MEQDIYKNMTPEMIATIKGSLIFAVVISIIVYTLYIRNLFRLISLVQPGNRKIKPSILLLISLKIFTLVAVVPFFFKGKATSQFENLIDGIQIVATMFIMIFTFYMVNKISESLEAELKSRGIHDIKPTLSLGIFMCICNAGSLLMGIAYLAPFGLIASVMGFVVWILYWIKTKEYRIKLQSMPPTNSLKDLGIF